MGVAVPARWIAALTGLSERTAQLFSYLVTPLLLVAILPVVQNAFPGCHCLVQNSFGVPCPGCGVTRSMTALIHGQVSAAWQFNPAGILVLAALLGQSLIALFELASRHRSPISLRYARASNTVVMATAVAVWLIRVVISVN